MLPMQRSARGEYSPLLFIVAPPLHFSGVIQYFWEGPQCADTTVLLRLFLSVKPALHSARSVHIVNQNASFSWPCWYKSLMVK